MRLQLSDDKNIDIEIKRKKIKNLILRVYPDGSVKLSAPNSAKNSEIKRFLENKSEWLLSTVQKMLARQSSDNSNQSCFRFLGEPKVLKIIQSDINTISIDENNFVIYINGVASAKKTLEKWWREKSLRYLNSKVDNYMALFNSVNIAKPKISIRKMKSLWGSCTPKKGTVRLNYYLLTAPDKCIDYIVLHELTHLIYPNHGKLFKAFLSKHMPDWKERKKVLNSIPYIEQMQQIEDTLDKLKYKV